jgi:hypothetical protein
MAFRGQVGWQYHAICNSKKQDIIDDNRDHSHWSTVGLIILAISFLWERSGLMEWRSQKRRKCSRCWDQNKNYRQMLPDQRINVKFWVLSSLARKLCLFGICNPLSDWDRRNGFKFQSMSYKGDSRINISVHIILDFTQYFGREKDNEHRARSPSPNRHRHVF